MRLGWIFLGAAVVGCSGAPGQDESTGTTSEALQQCAQNVVEGIDIYDGNGTIDWTSVKAAGVDFAMIKATQGTYNTQSTFTANWSGAKAAGLYRSAYHFFDPTEDGAAQAQHFLSVLGTPQPGDMPAMLDIECPDGDANCLYQGGAGQASASDIHTRMWAWIDAVEPPAIPALHRRPDGRRDQLLQRPRALEQRGDLAVLVDRDRRGRLGTGRSRPVHRHARAARQLRQSTDDGHRRGSQGCIARRRRCRGRGDDARLRRHPGRGRKLGPRRGQWARRLASRRCLARLARRGERGIQRLRMPDGGCRAPGWLRDSRRFRASRPVPEA